MSTTIMIMGKIGCRRPEIHQRSTFVLLLAIALALVALVLQQQQAIARSWPSLRPKKPTLCFDATGHFKIVQLTDLHVGEDPFSEWAPRADQRTLDLIRRILYWESPNLVIFSGDMLTANNIDKNATVYLDRLAAVLEEKEFGIPYAMIFGNHDDMDLEIKSPNGTIIDKIPAKTSRRQLVRSDQKHAHSLSQAGPADVFGVSNYILSVFGGDQDYRCNNDNNNSNLKLQIVLLDSGGGSLEQQIVSGQWQWYQSQRQSFWHVDAVAFQHIPTREFNFQQGVGGGCHGGLHEEGQVAPLHLDPLHELDLLQRNDPRLHFLAVGHNHGNSYCCPAVVDAANNTTTDNAPPNSNNISSSSRLHVCFGRHSGYGGYGEKHWLKGARIYDIWLDHDDNNSSVQWKTWVRLETGFTVDHYAPLSKRKHC